MVEGGGFEPPKLARQIYSLIPLATREPLRKAAYCPDGQPPCQPLLLIKLLTYDHLGVFPRRLHAVQLQKVYGEPKKRLEQRLMKQCGPWFSRPKKVIQVPAPQCQLASRLHGSEHEVPELILR